MSDITIGVDISKDTLDVYRHPEAQHCQFSNDAKRFGQAIGKLAKTDKMDAVLLAKFGAAAELRLRLAPPLQSHFHDLPDERGRLTMPSPPRI